MTSNSLSTNSSNSMFAPATHKKVLTIAFPMLISNISGPLLGMVDTAVLGHLEHAYYLGGAAVGAMLITLLIWISGFLRMSITGLVAQAFGRGDEKEVQGHAIRGGILALGLGLAFLVFHPLIRELGLWMADGSAEVRQQAQIYFDIRIWGLPFALLNLVLMGWLLGQQKSRAAMILVLVMNGINLVLDLWFVLGLNMGVAGAAWASVIAETACCLCGLWLFTSRQLALKLPWKDVDVSRDGFSTLLNLNRDILIRTLCLELCFAFVTFYGARLGDDIVATNAVLMNFLLFIALGLDAVAFAAEALIGEAKGAKDARLLNTYVGVTFIWSSALALVYALIFLLFGRHIIGLMSDIPSVLELSQNYLVYIVILPIAGYGCFLLDGVFIGLTRGKEMRNGMLISVFAGFFPIWWLLRDYGNHALWVALLSLMLLRGVTLAVSYFKLHRREKLLD